MITTTDIMSIPKGNLQEASKTLRQEDVLQLVEWLSLKDDNIRYQAFLLLQNRSSLFEDVYPHWGIFHNKKKAIISYQRSIGLMLIAENVKWDTQGKIVDTIDDVLLLLNDEKPITIRQCIQSLGKISSFRPGLNDKIASRLLSFNLLPIKETMRKSILLDILHVLLIIRNEHKTDEIEGFIRDALSGEVLDRKSKKQMEALI